jgi:tripartite-type tricarboxylate transporter receptor subunit TctC
VGNKRLYIILAACLLLGAGAGLSLAEDYPSRPVKIIIGFGAGAVADTPARLLARAATSQLNTSHARQTTATRCSWRRPHRPIMRA